MYWILMICFILIAGLRGNIDNDHQNYILLYENQDKNIIKVEPTFYLVSNFIKFLFRDIQYLFLFYAIIGVSLKFYAVKRISEFYFFSILIYFSYYFILQEMT